MSAGFDWAQTAAAPESMRAVVIYFMLPKFPIWYINVLNYVKVYLMLK